MDQTAEFLDACRATLAQWRIEGDIDDTVNDVFFVDGMLRALDENKPNFFWGCLVVAVHLADILVETCRDLQLMVEFDAEGAVDEIVVSGIGSETAMNVFSWVLKCVTDPEADDITFKFAMGLSAFGYPARAENLMDTREGRATKAKTEQRFSDPTSLAAWIGDAPETLELFSFVILKSPNVTISADDLKSWRCDIAEFGVLGTDEVVVLNPSDQLIAQLRSLDAPGVLAATYMHSALYKSEDRADGVSIADYINDNYVQLSELQAPEPRVPPTPQELASRSSLDDWMSGLDTTEPSTILVFTPHEVSDAEELADIVDFAAHPLQFSTLLDDGNVVLHSSNRILDVHQEEFMSRMAEESAPMHDVKTVVT